MWVLETVQGAKVRQANSWVAAPRSRFPLEPAAGAAPAGVGDASAPAKPGIADELVSFYAQHTGLIKTLGGAALAIAMSMMKDRMTQQPS
ncbi:hypothetical protein DBR47_21325 [Paucibacter sp. KBW04]|nr:hypothetical protein DBR47_21325 [Paucibacter sp. KBW04]